MKPYLTLILAHLNVFFSVVSTLIVIIAIFSMIMMGKGKHPQETAITNIPATGEQLQLQINSRSRTIPTTRPTRQTIKPTTQRTIRRRTTTTSIPVRTFTERTITKVEVHSYPISAFGKAEGKMRLLKLNHNCPMITGREFVLEGTYKRYTMYTTLIVVSYHYKPNSSFISALSV